MRGPNSDSLRQNVIFSTRDLTISAAVAAIYATLTLVFAPISFGQIQFRVSEALTLLPVLSLPSVPGLFVGCLLANYLGGAPWQDVIFGSLATLLAALLSRFLRKNLALAALMPVLLNGLIVGGMLSAVYGLPFFLTALFVALGEAGACYALGVPLILALRRRGLKL